MSNPVKADAELSQLLTAKQLADLLQLSTRSIWRLKNAAKLPAPIEIGGSVRWKREEVRQWIAEGCPDRQARQNTRGKK